MRASEFIPGELSPLSIPPKHFKFQRAVGPNGKPVANGDPVPRPQMNSYNPQDHISTENDARAIANAKIRDLLARHPLHGQ